MTLLDVLLDDLKAEGDLLWNAVAGLDEASWRKPTPAAGWDVATQVAHLLWTDEVAVLAATDTATRERLADLDYDFPALELLMAEQGWTTVHLFWAETPTLFHAQNPFPPGGVVEDPATGAAAAAFGGYLRALHLVPVPSRVMILQGQDMGAPSRLIIDLDDSAPGIEITGRATRLTGPIGG